MRLLRRRTISTAVLTLALGFAIAGCSDETGPEVNPAVVGTWNATSFLVPGTGDLIDLGMTMAFAFAGNGTYTFTVTNDQGGLCDGAADCSDSGSYTASDTQIVLDPEDDPQVLTYSIADATVTINADIDGTAVTLVMDKE
jgi:hypothetical protein